MENEKDTLLAAIVAAIREIGPGFGAAVKDGVIHIIAASGTTYRVKVS